MSTRKYTNKNPDNKGFLYIIEKYWLVILGFLFVLPIIQRYYQDAQQKGSANILDNEVKDLKNQNKTPQTQQIALDKITRRVDVQTIARNLAHHLGTIYSFYDPRHWSENDELAYKELAKIKQPTTVTLVSQCYFLLTGEKLIDDVKRLLDQKYLDKLPLFR